MTVIQERLPSNIQFGAISGPGYSTQVVATGGGNNYGNQYWKNPLRRYQIDTEHAGIAQFDALNRFVHAVAQGRGFAFRANDQSDNASAGGPFVAGRALTPITQAQFGVADGVTTVWQLFKPYVFNSKTYNRKITQPNTDTALQVFVANVLTAVTVNYSLGTVTFAVAPALNAALTWLGTFDVPVRFDADYTGLTFEHPTHINMKALTFTEERV